MTKAKKRRATDADCAPEDTTAQTVPVTLTIISISEDGEEAIVEDRHENRGVLSTAGDFMHDGDLDVGDTLLCDVLVSALQTPIGILRADEAPGTAAPGEQTVPEITAEEDAEPLLTPPHDVRKQDRRETIEVTIKLTESERLELAEEMAAALAERDKLEVEFAVVKKDYKARIDLQVSAAAEAGATFRLGERTQDVSCDVFEDRTTMEIVFCDSVTEREVYRRPMTYEERQHKLPLESPAVTSAGPATSEPAAATAPMAVNTHNCTTCGHFDQSTDDMPETCQTCAQVESGDTDNWTPLRICRTCTHVAKVVDRPPCSLCSLNADETHRGEEERWEWKNAEATPPEECADFSEADDMPVIPGVPEVASHPEA